MTDQQATALSKIARRLLTDLNCVANNTPTDEWIEQQQLQFVLEALEDGHRALRPTCPYCDKPHEQIWLDCPSMKQFGPVPSALTDHSR